MQEHAMLLRRFFNLSLKTSISFGVHCFVHSRTGVPQAGVRKFWLRVQGLGAYGFRFRVLRFRVLVFGVQGLGAYGFRFRVLGFWGFCIQGSGLGAYGFRFRVLGF